MLAAVAPTSQPGSLEPHHLRVCCCSVCRLPQLGEGVCLEKGCVLDAYKISCKVSSLWNACCLACILQPPTLKALAGLKGLQSLTMSNCEVPPSHDDLHALSKCVLPVCAVVCVCVRAYLPCEQLQDAAQP